MRVAFKTSFVRDLKRIRSKDVLGQVEEVIENVESAQSSSELPGLKKIRNEGRFYCMRIGDYRIGLTIENDIVTFVRFLHRGEMYRFFP